MFLKKINKLTVSQRIQCVEIILAIVILWTQHSWEWCQRRPGKRTVKVVAYSVDRSVRIVLVAFIELDLYIWTLVFGLNLLQSIVDLLTSVLSTVTKRSWKLHIRHIIQSKWYVILHSYYVSHTTKSLNKPILKYPHIRKYDSIHFLTLYIQIMWTVGIIFRRTNNVYKRCNFNLCNRMQSFCVNRCLISVFNTIHGHVKTLPDGNSLIIQSPLSLGQEQITLTSLQGSWPAPHKRGQLDPPTGLADWYVDAAQAWTSMGQLLKP